MPPLALSSCTMPQGRRVACGDGVNVAKTKHRVSRRGPGQILGRLADLSNSSIHSCSPEYPYSWDCPSVEPLMVAVACRMDRKPTRSVGKSKADQPSCGESIDATLKAIEKAGGRVVMPKHSIDEWGFMADFADPEGNVLSLWEKPKP